ncbi:MAG TPA: deoxyribodipyrimidine photo-lyase [Saprospiraceae bacterium]|nr:deoxyribodipyrimidine photo-lyase [Saprospiraceae bacterium]HMP23208.1 deoxyribodipyrimidine photo-lyase [Saprospiraceae bacterium]
MAKVTIFWFRRDLRLQDNAGLYHALRSGQPVLPLFIFDRHILDELSDPQDARVGFIHQTINTLHQELAALGSSIIIRYGKPAVIWPELLQQYDITAVFCNHDYEPYAIQRDTTVQNLLQAHHISFKTYKDHVIFEQNEVVKNDGLPYTVFTPYSRKWRERLQSKMVVVPDANGAETRISYYLQAYPTEKYAGNFYKTAPLPLVALSDMGFAPSPIPIPPKEVSRGLIKNYDKTRDIPGIAGTSRLGIHFRFGTISIREKARRAQLLNDTFLNELIWRDFYAQILAHFPRVVHESFRPEYDRIAWRDSEADFAAWCAGRTGYPIVDAGMRELNATGYMHNRVRMITASFFTKHLLLDWRRGEAYFAEKLLDYDLASNNGGWQWAAGSGTDAAPYFRIFNPYTQQQKFDANWQYIQRWVPEYGTKDYPPPIVEHKFARERCLEVYKAGLAKEG